MPNWCENELTIQGKSGVRTCLQAIQGDVEDGVPRYIDFQRIVPMPAILEGTSSPADKRGLVLLGDDALGREMLSYPWVRATGITDLEALRKYLREHCPESEEAERRSFRAKHETGCHDWYEWRVNTTVNGNCHGHWGTKWNASCCACLNDPTDMRAVIAFSTAWSPPQPVIIELSKTFPTLTFTLKYWERGCGCRGILRARAGKVLRDVSYDYSGPRGG